VGQWSWRPLSKTKVKGKHTMSELKKFKIDVTPSWSFTVKGLLLVIETHLKKSLLNDESQAWLYIKEEFARCGDLADRFANEVKDGKIETPITVVDKTISRPEISVAEVEATLKDCRDGAEECSNPDDTRIYDGWVEALEYVLGNRKWQKDLAKEDKDADTEVKG